MDKALCPQCNSENLPNARYCAACGHTLQKAGTYPGSAGQGETSSSVQLMYTPPPGRSKRKVIAAIVAICFIGLMSLLVYARIKLADKLTPESVESVLNRSSGSSEPENISVVLVETASKLTASCPIMVDDYTRLDSVSAQTDNTLLYSYTLVKSDESEVNTDTLEHYIRPTVISNIRTNPAMKAIKDNKVTMAYNYCDKNGIFVLKITILPEDYE